MSIVAHRSTRLSYQTWSLGNLRCQPLDSQLSADERRFCWANHAHNWRNLWRECVFSLHYSYTLNIRKYLKVLKYKVNIFTIHNRQKITPVINYPGNFFSTRHYLGTQARKITEYVHATFVQLKLALSVLIIVCICAAAQNSYRIEKWRTVSLSI